MTCQKITASKIEVTWYLMMCIRMVDIHLSNSDFKKEQYDPYRWYLCKESRSGVWSCNETEAERALSYVKYKGESTRAIMVWRTIPRILDPLILHKRLHPQVKINM